MARHSKPISCKIEPKSLSLQERKNMYEGVAFNRYKNHKDLLQSHKQGGEVLAKASLVLQSSGRTIPQNPYDRELEAYDSIEQERLVEAFAKESGYWFPNPHDHYKESGYRFYGFGGEAQAYIEGEDQFVHKICRISQYDSVLHFMVHPRPRRTAGVAATAPATCL